jgi:hypothetical protein
MVILVYLAVSCLIDVTYHYVGFTKEKKVVIYSLFTIFELYSLLVLFKYIGVKIANWIIALLVGACVAAEWWFYNNTNLQEMDYIIVSAEYLVLLVGCIAYFAQRSSLATPSKQSIWQSSRLWTALAIFIYVATGFLYFTFFNNIGQEKLINTGLVNLPSIALILRNIFFGISFLKKQP